MPMSFAGGPVHWIPTDAKTRETIQRLVSSNNGVRYSYGVGPLVEAAILHAKQNQILPLTDFRPDRSKRMRVVLQNDYRDPGGSHLGALLAASMQRFEERRKSPLLNYGRREQYYIDLPARLLIQQGMLAFRDGHPVIEDLTASLEETLRLIIRDLTYLDGRIVTVDVPVSKSLYDAVRKISWMRAKFEIDTLIAQRLDAYIRSRTVRSAEWR